MTTRKSSRRKRKNINYMSEGFKGRVFKYASPCSVVRKSSGETETLSHRLKGQSTAGQCLVARKF
jgi:hypothetical protein